MLVSVFLVFNQSTNKLTKQLELGRNYLLEENYEQAIVAFTKAIEIDNNNIEAYNMLADIYMAQGKYEEAKKILEQGIKVTQDQSLLEKSKKVIIFQETRGICEKIINNCNSNDHESILENAKSCAW